MIIMKKFFTICALAVGLTHAAKAQVLATFEDFANDQLELGDKWYEKARFVVEPSVGDNSAKGGLNTSNKCFVAVNVADADWWGNFGELKLKTPVVITAQNRYLKFLAYRSIQPKDFRVGINGDHEEASSVYQKSLSADSKWEGVVVDLGAKFMGQELKSIVFLFSCNWTTPRSGWGAATYMYDNFELSDTPLPPGVTEVTDLSDFYINFEDQSKIDKWVSAFDPINASNAYQIVDNPVKSEINPTVKAVKFDKSADASWWQGFRTVFNGALKVSNDHKYLHAMLWVPQSALNENTGSVDVQLCAKDFSGNENNRTEKIWDDQVDEWIDVVMEISSLSYVSELTVRFDVQQDNNGNYINSPANTYYVDEIALSSSPDARSSVSGIKKGTVGQQAIWVSGKNDAIEVHSEIPANVKVYSLLGRLIHETSFSGSVLIPSQKGAYLVKVDSGANSKTSKVLVK
jgi:hypothetical protein